MNKQTVIVTGGMLDATFACSILRKSCVEEIIAVDKGLLFLHEHGITPTYIVGDFDSAGKELVQYYQEQTQIPIRRYNPIKDASDTEIAIRDCVDRHSREVIILGGSGTRLDHTWANVQCLTIAAKAGVEAYLLDPHNRIRVVYSGFSIRKEEQFGSYVSLFPIGGCVEGLTIRGVKYPLQDHRLEACDSLSVSNEIVEEEMEVRFRSGCLVVMETRD